MLQLTKHKGKITKVLEERFGVEVLCSPSVLRENRSVKMYFKKPITNYTVIINCYNISFLIDGHIVMFYWDYEGSKKYHSIDLYEKSDIIVE
jgi:hypothetical protein